MRKHFEKHTSLYLGTLMTITLLAVYFGLCFLVIHVIPWRELQAWHSPAVQILHLSALLTPPLAISVAAGICLGMFEELRNKMASRLAITTR